MASIGEIGCTRKYHQTHPFISPRYGGEYPAMIGTHIHACMHAHSKTSATIVGKLQFADDTAVIFLHPEGLQRTVESSFKAYNRMG